MTESGEIEAPFMACLPYTIRPCRAEDLAALEWFGRFSDHRRILQHTFAQVEQGKQLMWVADLAGFPAGQVWVELPLARLWAARVWPPLRGAGIGARLADVAEHDLSMRGCAEASVTVETSNAGALRFWMRRGYRPISMVSEPWAYDTPEHVHVEKVSELYVLIKQLARERHDRHPLDDR